MHELVQVTENVYYIDGATQIGIVKTGDSEVCLIDSGYSGQAEKKIWKIMQERGWKLSAIFNTHGHADHTGGNAFFQEKTGCKIYAPRIDADIANNPILSPSILYGGYAPKEMHTRLLLAPESRVQELSDEVLPDGMSVIELPGHCFHMVGYRTKDDVVFLADAVCSKEILAKSHICFLYDVKRQLESLEKIEKMQAEWFIPTHAAATKDIAPLAGLNRDKIWEVTERILTICREPVIFEDLLQKLFVHYDIRMNFTQYALIGSTVRSYLSWLKDEEKVREEIDNCYVYWKTL